MQNQIPLQSQYHSNIKSYDKDKPYPPLYLPNQSNQEQCANNSINIPNNYNNKYVRQIVKTNSNINKKRSKMVKIVVISISLLFIILIIEVIFIFINFF